MQLRKLNIEACWFADRIWSAYPSDDNELPHLDQLLLWIGTARHSCRLLYKLFHRK